MKAPLFVIIASAGKSTRFKNHKNKILFNFKGFPLIYYSIRNFLNFPYTGLILVTYNPSQKEDMLLIMERYFAEEGSRLRLMEGGSERYHTVFNGLNFLKDCGIKGGDIVAVHDGARPFFSVELLKRLYEGAIFMGNAVPVIRFPDTVRYISKENGFITSYTLSRKNIYIVQTPQIFTFSDIYCAYTNFMKSNEDKEDFTDDASIVEAYGGVKINPIEGELSNIKITYYEDIARVAELEDAPGSGPGSPKGE